MSEKENVENVDEKPTNPEGSTEEPQASEPSPEEQAKLDEQTELNEMFGEKEQNVPYSRFQKVIGERNESRDEIAQIKAEFDTRLEEAVLKAKATNYFSQKEATQEEDPYEFVEEVSNTPAAPSKEVEELKGLVSVLTAKIEGIEVDRSNNKLEARISSLKKSFENMNETEVLAFAKLKPGKDLESLAKFSHDRNTKLIKDKVEAYLAKKKEEASVEISGPERIRSIKEKTEIKDNKDAKEAMKKYLGI